MRKRSDCQDAFLAPLFAPLVGAAGPGNRRIDICCSSHCATNSTQSEIKWAKASGEVPGLVLPPGTVEEIIADSQNGGEERIEHTA